MSRDVNKYSDMTTNFMLPFRIHEINMYYFEAKSTKFTKTIEPAYFYFVYINAH